METATVKAIKQRAIKSGTSSNGRDWQMDLVILDTGEEVRIFSPIEINDEVESYDNNGYKNWRLKDGGQEGTGGRQRTASPSTSEGGITTDQIYAEVLKISKRQDEIVDRLRALMGEEPATEEVAQEQATKAADKAAAEHPDPVVEVGDEPINLDDIPF